MTPKVAELRPPHIIEPALDAREVADAGRMNAEHRLVARADVYVQCVSAACAKNHSMQATVEPERRAWRRMRTGDAAIAFDLAIAGSAAMFIAEMYEYGMDDACVGVDGIDSCMGVFVLHEDKLYAIHVPSGDTEVPGLKAFVDYLKNDNAYRGGGKIYAVVNGTSRGDRVKAEVLEYHRLLEAEETNIVRIKGYKEISLAIVCERNLHGGGVILKCIEASNANWVPGKGAKRHDAYHKKGWGDHAYGVGSTDGWTIVASPNNCQIIPIGTSADALPLMTPSTNKKKKTCLIQ